ncbi:hypothetical protein KC19_8G189100, partial [Ceratodon purpureus]
RFNQHNNIYKCLCRAVHNFAPTSPIIKIHLHRFAENPLVTALTFFFATTGRLQESPLSFQILTQENFEHDHKVH